MLFEIEPEFLYQEVHMAYYSVIVGENKEQQYATWVMWNWIVSGESC